MSTIKVLLFRHHARDPLSWIIDADTRGSHSHAAFLSDGTTNEICEAFWPHVRYRKLADSELSGIDVYDIPALTTAQDDDLHAYLTAAVMAMEPYSIADLLKFNPLIRSITGDMAPSPSLHAPTFCSMFVMRAMTDGAHFPLLNAQPQDVSPEILSYSTLLVPDAPLKPVPEATTAIE